MRVLLAYLAAAIVFIVVDLIWIVLVVLDVYAREIGDMLSDSPNGAAAGVFYIGYIAGILLLASLPAVEKRSWKVAAINGAALGAIAYGTYTVTNYAVLTGWTMTLVVSDTVWGAFITGLCAVVAYIVAQPASSLLRIPPGGAAPRYRRRQRRAP